MNLLYLCKTGLSSQIAYLIRMGAGRPPPPPPTWLNNHGLNVDRITTSDPRDRTCFENADMSFITILLKSLWKSSNEKQLTTNMIDFDIISNFSELLVLFTVKTNDLES